jgi:FkbM family methyltransferase
MLRRNLAEYRNERRARIETINAAVCAEKGRVRLFVPRSSVAAHVMPKSYIVLDPHCVDVSAITVEEAVGPGCDFLKVDAEGVEYDLLQNAICRPDRIREIAVEFHDIPRRCDELDAVVALLTSRGYRLHGDARAAVVHFA